MITGAAPETGKSFISANLAAVMAQSGKKVLLIDADMRKGHLRQVFGLHSELGLNHILSGQASPNQAIQATSIENLSVLENGGYPDNPSELLLGKRFNELLAYGRTHFDYVIIDTPPILAVTDASIVGQHAGTTLMVARYGYTTAKELEISVERLKQGNVQIKGVILNGMKRENNNDYDYYVYANYGYNGKAKK